MEMHMYDLNIEIGTYGQYSSDNYGTARYVRIPGIITLYYSYETIVAFDYKGKRYVSENVWSNTTGKHLNWLEPDVKKRLNHELFSQLLKDVLKKIKIVVYEEV